MAPDEQDRAEALDDDKQPAEYPPEEPLGVDEYGTTAAEERWEEPLAERLAREEPEDRPADTAGMVLVAPDEGVHEDTEPDAVATAVDTGAGALDVGDIAAGDSTLRDTATEREGTLSPEEAAIHVVDEV